jgi:hypothetical protein
MARQKVYLNNPNLPTVDAQFDYGIEEIKEIKKCQDNILHFAENYFYIITDGDKIKIPLHTYQKKSLRMMRDNRFSLLLFARQSGKSTISTIYCLWTACFNEHQNILIVANKESTAKEIFKRIRLAYEELPNWLKPGVKEYGKESMELANGSRIGITTTTGSAGRGSSANLLFVDEADWIEPHLLESFWASVYPIISNSKKSKIIMASTPRDTSGLFFKLYDGSVKNENSWVNMKVPWYDVPGRDEKWKKETMGSLASPEDFLREFECIFDEVGESSINASTFDSLRTKASPPEYVYMEGSYKIWELPKDGKLYVAGVDVAEGVGKDNTVVQILDLTNLRAINQVAVYTSNTISPIEFTSKLHEILQQWGSPLLLVERDKCGAQVVDNLRKDYLYENIISYGFKELNRSTVPLGVVCHTNTKYDNVTNQRYWINTIDAVRINDLQTVEELRDFVRLPNGTWKAKQDKHDDRVMSLGWALLILHEKLISKYFEVIATDENNKPASIRPYDWGVGATKNPNSFYMNENDSGVYNVIPTMFGNQMYIDNDLNDMMQSGWKPLE